MISGSVVIFEIACQEVLEFFGINPECESLVSYCLSMGREYPRNQPQDISGDIEIFFGLAEIFW